MPTNPQPRRVPLTPGSHLSRQHGCQCPAVANQYGAGIHGPDVPNPQWMIAEECGLHAHLAQPARMGGSAT